MYICVYADKESNKYITAIAALKGQFVGHCHHSIVFSKVLRPFLATFWVSRGSVVTIKIILV